MKYSYKVSDAIHILAYISIVPAGNLSSATIAESIESNASVVRRLMSNLKDAGLLTSTAGTAKPKLAKPASEITLLDIFKAVETNHDILHVDPRTNMDCPIGANIQQTLNVAYARIQNATEKEMQKITVQEIIDGVQKRYQQNIS